MSKRHEFSITRHSIRHLNAALCSCIALSIVLAPVSAMAENTTLKLRPLQKESKNKTYVAPKASNPEDAYNTYNELPNTPNPTFDPNLSKNNGTYNDPNANAYNNSNNAANMSFPTANTPVNADNTPSENYLHGRLVSLPKGTLMSVHVDNQLTASASHPGDPVTATLENDVY